MWNPVLCSRLLLFSSVFSFCFSSSSAQKIPALKSIRRKTNVTVFLQVLHVWHTYLVLIKVRMESNSLDPTVVAMAIATMMLHWLYHTAESSGYLCNSRRRNGQWCPGSRYGLGCCRWSAPLARLHHSSSAVRWWGSGRCRLQANRDHTGLGQPAKPSRAAQRWPAVLLEIGSGWRLWKGSASVALWSGTLHLEMETELVWKLI